MLSLSTKSILLLLCRGCFLVFRCPPDAAAAGAVVDYRRSSSVVLEIAVAAAVAVAVAAARELADPK